MEPFQVHALIQVSSLVFLLLGVYYARNHNLRRHHAFIYIALGLLTAGVVYTLYTIGGAPSTHGRVGLFVYVYTLFVAFSGRAFLGGKVKRKHHRLPGGTAILLLVLQTLFALYSYVL